MIVVIYYYATQYTYCMHQRQPAQASQLPHAGQEQQQARAAKAAFPSQPLIKRRPRRRPSDERPEGQEGTYVYDCAYRTYTCIHMYRRPAREDQRCSSGSPPYRLKPVGRGAPPPHRP